MHLSDILTRSAAAFPQRTAAICSGESLTFAQWWQRSSALAERLRELDLPAHSHVALLFENSIDYLVSFFAVFQAGLVAVPMDTSLAPEKINYIVKDSEAVVLFVQGRFRRHLSQIVEGNDALRFLFSDKPLDKVVDSIPSQTIGEIIEGAESRPLPGPVDDSVFADDGKHELAAIFYTSGSTGVSKGVMLSHRNLVSNTLATVEYLRLTGDDSIMVILPFYYIYGNSLLLTHVACGGTLVIDNRFMYPEVVLDAMEEHRVTGFSGVPSHFMLLLHNSSFTKRKLSGLRYFTQAGGAMAPEVTRQIIDAFGHKELFIMYGQTEAAPRVTWLPPDRLVEKLGSIGIEVPGVTVEILDESGNEVAVDQTGELVVSGPNVMMGYFKQPEETAQVLKNGKLYTGDLARRDSEGFYFITGRRREIIKSGGNRVSAKEVEERILEHEKVAEVAVFGVPDNVLGEAIKAVVVTKNSDVLAEKDIQTHCQKTLAVHKIPRFVSFVDSLPKLQSGKVNKLLLKEQHAGGAL
ncbi:acyl--CoA ligase [bacterium]|nr:acyl--CoA ligase [bacterium]